MPTLRERHRHVLMPWSIQRTAHDGPAMVAGEGCFLADADGARYFDLSSGWIAANLGHGHPELAEAIADQVRRLAYAPPIFPNDARAELAWRLSALSPWNEGARVHFTTGGGEANDDAVKTARHLTGRQKVMAAYRSYHGTTGGASGMTGDMRRWANEPAAAPAVRFFAPYPYRSPFHAETAAQEVERAIDHLERILTQEGAHNVAALVIEPMVGSSGVIPYPDGYLQALRDLTARHGIVLIFDEVMTGFGRTGAAFAAERLGVAPDMIVFGKGVNGAVLPLGGFLLREGLAHRFDDRLFDAGHTHAGHPVAMASGVATLELYARDDLFARGRAMETLFRRKLDDLRQRHAIVGDVRGLGAFFGIELVRDRGTRTPLIEWYATDKSLNDALVAKLLDLGVWCYVRYGIFMLAPPLIASDAELEAALDKVSEALTWLEAQL